MKALTGTSSGKPRLDAKPAMVLPLTIVVWREGADWVSQVLEFEISSFGTSADEAAREALDAACSYLNTLDELHEREAVFANRNIEVFISPPDDLPLRSLPREMLGRDEVQIRPMEVPLNDLRHAVPA